MKVVYSRPPECRCTEKLWDFYNAQDPALGVGSIVECDCGQRWTLSDSQRDGKFWIKKVLRGPGYADSLGAFTG